MESSQYMRLRKVNVSEKTEKKNGMTYLSWAYAVDQLLQLDPNASWEYGTPVMYGETMMVFCTVTAFGKAMTAHLPVMNHMNKAIANPNAFEVNTAMQRCLVKAIALHGLGLYIYAGEDLPAGDDPASVLAGDFLHALGAPEKGTTEEAITAAKATRLQAIHERAKKDSELYTEAWKLIDSKDRSAIKKYLDMAKAAV